MRHSGQLLFLCLVLSSGATGAVQGQDNQISKRQIRVVIAPFYDWDGPKVEVGEYGKEIAASDAKSIVSLSVNLKKQREKLKIETMYVLAIRLYDLGQKDESVYWFYSAQYRAKVFAAVLDKKSIGGIGDHTYELTKAHIAFFVTSGMYINGYAFGKLDMLEQTILKVIDEGKKLPNFSAIYPTIKFIDSKTWQESNSENRSKLESLLEYIKKNRSLIKKQRTENGIEEKF